MSPEKMIGLSFAAPAAKLYEVFDKLIIDRRLGRGAHVLSANAHSKKNLPDISVRQIAYSI